MCATCGGGLLRTTRNFFPGITTGQPPMSHERRAIALACGSPGWHVFSYGQRYCEPLQVLQKQTRR